MIPNSAKIVNTTVDITQYINTEYFSVNNGVAYLIKIGKLRMIKVDVTLKKAITKDTYVFNFPSNFLKGMINTYFFGNVINRNGKAYEVAFYNQLASNNFSILLQVTAGNTIENNSRLIGEWTGFCSADINDISEEKNQFITYNQFNTLISETLKDYTKNVVLEESQTQQDELIQKLQSNMIQESTEEATSLHVEDASDLPAKLNIRGNHYQKTQEGTSNLAILQEGTIEQDGITVDIKEGNIKINGTNTTTNTLSFKVGTVKLIEGETYYLKRFGTVNGTGLYLNNSGTQIWGQNSEISFIAKATGTFAISLTVGTSTINNTIQQILVSKISGRNWIEGKVPIPSVEYPSEISTVKDNIKIIQCNSNFLKKQEVSEVTENGITGKVLDDGSIVLNGTTQYATYIQITEELQIGRIATGQNFKKYVLQKGSYKFNCQVSGQASDSNLNAYIRNSVNTSSFSQTLNRLPENSFKEIEFTTDKEEYVAYLWINSGITLTDFTLKFMLKRADDNSEYVQNEQKEYNLAVQQEMLKNDYFDVKNNKEIHNYEKKNLRELSWQVSSNPLQTETFSFVVMFSNEELLSTEINCLSNCFKSKTASYLYNNDEEGIAQSKSQIMVRIGKEKVADIEEFKTLLAEKNAVVYVKKRSELDLTEEQKQVLNELNALELFKGTNNIYTEQDLALLQLNYTADTKMYIDNKINSILGGK